MQRCLNVHFLPALVSTEQLAGKTVIVIDVLRATTTITQALAAGATEIIPCLEVSEAQRKAAKFRGPKLLGGERGGVKIEGFDLGNSPAEYTAPVVQRKTVFFTTTNGTRAMLLCRDASRVLLGAFTNLSALCDEIRDERETEIVCAGTDGQITREDVLLAGAIAKTLSQRGELDFDLSDSAQIARDAWLTCQASGESLENLLRASQGGRDLIELSQARDILLAAQVDQHQIVPELLLAEGRIVAGA